MDYKVLMDGYCVCRDWMLEHTELDVDSHITTQSLASPFMLKSGCYENVLQTSGVLQQFISRCVVGGRVMCNPNKMYHVKKKTAELDVCSLYPSAMVCMLGFLMGLPNALANTYYDVLNSQDGYAVRFRITKLNKHLDGPLTNKMNEETGVRDVINEVENEITCIDKAGLEDLITLHDAEFEVTDGYYYNSGRNNRINNVVKNLYDLRLKLKKEKIKRNPAQVCY